MYICMYVHISMYVCMYVRIYVCMYMAVYFNTGGMWTTVEGGAALRHSSMSHGAAATSGGGGGTGRGAAVLPLPVDNHELVYGRWEDNIIWDSEVMMCY